MTNKFIDELCGSKNLADRMENQIAILEARIKKYEAAGMPKMAARARKALAALK